MSTTTRRKFLASTAVVAGSAAITGITGCESKVKETSGLSNIRSHPLDGITRENMKITDIKITLLSYKLKPEEQWADGDENSIIWKTTTVLIEVFTDAGIVGIGGASRYNGPAEMKKYIFPK